ncbi:hypothetical protein GCM10027063_07000 [Promicromonospora xylanilytica]
MTSTPAANANGAEVVHERHVEVLQVPDCPLVGGLLDLVRDAEADAGVRVAVKVLVGDYPSPTLVVDGLDVATGETVPVTPCCRLDLPTRRQIVDALVRAR